jgi:hypothetical protein
MVEVMDLEKYWLTDASHPIKTMRETICMKLNAEDS